jgi:hypothetical protein
MLNRHHVMPVSFFCGKIFWLIVENGRFAPNSATEEKINKQ